MPRWILASASPRRHDLLRLLLPGFEVVPSNLEERAEPGEPPEALVQRLAREKALTVQGSYPDATILSADTVVVCSSQILNKPASPEEAREMLRKLSGQTHRVLTGVCVVEGKRSKVDFASTNVKFSILSGSEIDSYVNSGEPLDKAGAYAVQGRGARFIESIDGCYFNVVGLPVSLLYRMLKELGYELSG